MPIHKRDARANQMVRVLKELLIRDSVPVVGIRAAIRGESEEIPFENGAEWGWDANHDWMDFRFSVTTPENYRGKVTLSVASGREGLSMCICPIRSIGL